MPVSSAVVNLFVGVAGAGASMTFASPAGASNNVTPGAPYPNVGRIFVTLAAGNANWTGMAGLTDGQRFTITNVDPANTLTLNNQNAGSAAANRFFGVGDLVLPPGASASLEYSSTRGVIMR